MFASGLRLRRSTHFKRQNHVLEEGGLRRQASEPAAPPPLPPALRKHDSYPQYVTKVRRPKTQEQGLAAVLIRSASSAVIEDATPRVSHTPAVRSGPPLSCNFCWNTVDECGRILRRKTQYHCPECRTNLCIVPCFHEYHEAETEPPPNVR